jgi:hypothetical protein
MLSPSWDIWALGCVYLEFITWFFGGWEAVVDFAHRREAVDPYYHSFWTATFFAIENDKRSGVPRAKVKDSVTQVSLFRFLDVQINHR